jgi:hypothetical protein
MSPSDIGVPQAPHIFDGGREGEPRPRIGPMMLSIALRSPSVALS